MVHISESKRVQKPHTEIQIGGKSSFYKDGISLPKTESRKIEEFRVVGVGLRNPFHVSTKDGSLSSKTSLCKGTKGG